MTIVEKLLGLIAVEVTIGLLILVYCALSIRRIRSVYNEAVLAIKTTKAWAAAAEREVGPALSEVKAAVKDEIQPKLKEMADYQHDARHEGRDIGQAIVSKLDVVERSVTPPQGRDTRNK